MKKSLRLFSGITLSLTLCLALLVGCGSGEEGGEDGDNNENCESPLVWDDDSSSCVAACETGKEWDADSESCVDIVPDCNDGEELDTDTNSCVSVCDDGYEWSTETEDCEFVIPDCGTGMKYDAEKDMCLPLTEEDKQRMYCEEYAFSEVKNDAGYDVISLKSNLYYNGYSSNDDTAERIFIHQITSSSSVEIGKAVDLTDNDTSLDTCKFCVVLNKNCEEEDGKVTCDKFMPMGFGQYTITEFTAEEGSTYSGTLNNVIFREVKIDEDGKTVPVVPGGETLCMDTYEFSGTTAGGPGYVYMDKPLDAGCEYPEGPYNFYGPKEGSVDVEAGTMPPMAWPGAYIDEESVGFDIAKYRCENPDIKTLFIILGAGWCSACSAHFGDMVCNANGILDQIHAQNAEILFVIGETNKMGSPADNKFANSYMNFKGCEGGIRVSDIDNTAKRRVLYGNEMSEGIPWAAAVRMSDMKVMAVQPDLYYLNYVKIATDNNK